MKALIRSYSFMLKLYFLVLLILITVVISLANNVPQSDTLKKAASNNTYVDLDTTENFDVTLSTRPDVAAALSDFPSLHPLIIHFAIVLIIVAAVMQLFNLFLQKSNIALFIIFFLTTGVIAAIIASNGFHPHTEGLSRNATLVLENHEHWAEWTIRLSVAALAGQVIYFFLFNLGKIPVHADPNTINKSKRYRGLAILIAIIMLSGAFCVTRAGHFGAQLVHIEGVGPQGRFLETRDDH